jgi:hypothetical protein
MQAPTVVLIKEDGHAEALATRVDKVNRTMTAQITHFSIYGGAETILRSVWGILF